MEKVNKNTLLITLMNKLKKFIKKEDLLKEEIEDAMASALEKLGANVTVQEAEKALILAGLKAGMTFIQVQTGAPISPTDEQYKQIVGAIMTAKGKLMPKVIAQLRKK